MAEEKIYQRVEAAEGMIKSLCEKYPEILWRVRPAKVSVLGITNKDRSKKSKDLFKVSPVKGVQKALNIIYNVPVSFIVEVFWTDWNSWNLSLQEWVIFKALLCVGEEDGKIVKTDCREFRIILDILGVDWEKKEDLPSLTMNEIPFKKELRPAIEVDAEESDVVEDFDNEDEKDEKPKADVTKPKVDVANVANVSEEDEVEIDDEDNESPI